MAIDGAAANADTGIIENENKSILRSIDLRTPANLYSSCMH